MDVAQKATMKLGIVVTRADGTVEDKGIVCEETIGIDLANKIRELMGGNSK
jgi:hypothetical protein